MTDSMTTTRISEPARASDAVVSISIYFLSVKAGSMRFRVEDPLYNTIAEDVSLEEILDRADWRVFSAVVPLKRDLEGQPAPDNLMDMIHQLKDVDKAYKALIEESSSARGKRYEALVEPGGLINQLDRRRVVLRYGINVAMLLSCGLTVNELKDLV